MYMPKFTAVLKNAEKVNGFSELLKAEFWENKIRYKIIH